MSLWSAFHPYVLPEVIGAPAPLITQKVREACREFCRRSRVWKVWATQITADGVLQTFTIALPVAETELVRIERVTVGGVDYDVRSDLDLPPTWQEAAGDTAGLTRTALNLSDTQLRIYALPTSGLEIEQQYSLMPSAASTGVADVIFSRYGKRIAAGALSDLFAMTGRSWAAPDKVALMREQFEDAIHDAAGERFRRNARLRTGRTIL
jgi:hypothetical protein